MRSFQNFHFSRPDHSALSQYGLKQSLQPPPAIHPIHTEMPFPPLREDSSSQVFNDLKISPLEQSQKIITLTREKRLLSFLLHFLISTY
ncbi:MAG: hypothetical protein K0S07_1430 [Chlamydiales bacterium]|jgi:hypothetical protein|nr:hypothetical protein [Chlamydiales bacterium]